MIAPSLRFHRLRSIYAVVRLASDAPIPAWAARSGGEFISITRTQDELSIVCAIENLAPGNSSHQRWQAMQLEGPFPFTQTGVLLSFIGPLSTNNIPIFAVSTYDTDYVLVPEEFAERAILLLREAGHLETGS